MAKRYGIAGCQKEYQGLMIDISVAAREKEDSFVRQELFKQLVHKHAVALAKEIEEIRHGESPK